MDKKFIVVVGIVFSIGVLVGMVVASMPGWRIYDQSHHQINQTETTVPEHEMHAAMNDMMVGLSGKTGVAFDKVFLQEMIIHHEGAVEMAKAALEQAHDQRIKDLATAIITAQEKEIAAMRTWQNDSE